MMAYDTSRVLSVNKSSDAEYFVQHIGLKDKEIICKESFSGEFIKVKDVQQNAAGTKYAVMFFDDGLFKIRTFGQETRNRT